MTNNTSLMSRPTFATVFDPSPTFTIDYLRAFVGSVRRHHGSKSRIICFTDYDGKGIPLNVDRIQLKHDWASGWWTKMELFRPDVSDDLIFSDLDNLITRPLDFVIERLNPERPLMIKDLDKKQERLQSAFMWLPHKKKSIVWNPFIESPERHISDAGAFGDAKIIRTYYTRENTDVFQDVFPDGSICSFSYHYQRGIHRNAAIVCFHGKKRKPTLVSRSDPLVRDHFFRYL